MKTAVIYNSRAGSMLNRIRKHFIKDIKDLMGENYIKADFFDIASKDTTKILSSAANDGYDAVVVAGGDGTVRSVAGYLSGSHTPLGIIPVGTFNNFARDNGIPLNYIEAIRTIANKNIEEISTGEVSGKVFINNSTVGFYSKIIKNRNYVTSGTWTSLIKAMFLSFKKFPLLEIKINAAGGQSIIRAPFIFIGNSKYKIDFLNIGAKYEKDGPFLNVYYPLDTGIFTICRFAFKVLINNLKEDRDYKIISAEELEVTSGEEKVVVSLDGEIFHIMPPLKYKLNTKHLKIITPLIIKN